MDEKNQDTQLNQTAGLTTTRIEALSDGVFAIAMTILVLDFLIPTNLNPEELIKNLAHLWPHFIAYYLSFIALGIFWVSHSTQFYWIKRSNRSFLWLNIYFLLFIALIPFSTLILGEYSTQEIAIAIYGLNLIICAIFLNFQWNYATKRNKLTSNNLSHSTVRLIKMRTWFAIILYAVAILFSPISTTISIVIFLIGQVLAIIPYKKLDKLLISA